MLTVPFLSKIYSVSALTLRNQNDTKRLADLLTLIGVPITGPTGISPYGKLRPSGVESEPPAPPPNVGSVRLR